MEKVKWLKIKRILNIIIGVSIGAFIGKVLWVFIDYKTHPDLYASYSAPWYSQIIVAAIFWGVVLFIEFIVFLFVRHKLNSGPTIGVIERKE